MIAMHQSVLVGVLQTQRPAWRTSSQASAIGSGPNAAHDFGQVQAVDELHDQHRRAVDLPGVVGLDDVRVGEAADGLHFAFEAGDGLLGRPRGRGKGSLPPPRDRAWCAGLYTRPPCRRGPIPPKSDTPRIPRQVARMELQVARASCP